jgi:aminoglycoside phosphotransferase (APT) family kinase protein
MDGASSALLPEEVRQFLLQAGLGEPLRAIALGGGVSSEIWRVDLPRGPVCVKRALPRLRVQQVWEAPVERNAYEYEWFRVAADAAPGAVPSVLARGEGAFAMDYLPEERYPVWKSLLRDGHADPAFAARVGATLARIHGATAGREDIRARFATDTLFHALRLEPYLVSVARQHADVRSALEEIIQVTSRTKHCLVHGDVSPKNILAGPKGPVFLDAECAWYGEPAFDLAFCLNHLLLKCLWRPQAAAQFLHCFDALSSAYLKGVTWEGPGALEQRAARLLPGLLLARVDGKSPVEYLTAEPDRKIARDAAKALLLHPPRTLAALRETWQGSLK